MQDISKMQDLIDETLDYMAQLEASLTTNSAHGSPINPRITGIPGIPGIDAGFGIFKHLASLETISGPISPSRPLASLEVIGRPI